MSEMEHSHVSLFEEVFAVDFEPQREMQIRNKNTKQALIDILETLVCLRTTRGYGMMGIFFRDRKVFLLTNVYLASIKCWFEGSKHLPSTFIAYMEDSGKLLLCRKSPGISPHVQSVFAYLDDCINSRTLCKINFNDLHNPISLAGCKSKAFVKDFDKSHFDCFKTHAGSTLKVCPHGQPVHNLPAQEFEHNSVQVEDDANGFSSIAPSSSIRDIPLPSFEHVNFSFDQSPSLLRTQTRESISFDNVNMSFGRNPCDDNLFVNREDSNRRHGRNTQTSEVVLNHAILESHHHQQQDASYTSDSCQQANSIVHNPGPDYPTAKYPNFKKDEDRRNSFSNWPRMLPSVQELVQSGFFYTGIGDLVRCFCCGIGLKDFSDTDNPLMEHVKHAGNCAFLLEYFGSRDNLQRYTRSIPTQEPEEIRRQQRMQYNSLQGCNVNGYRAKHERFRFLQARLDTFTNWPTHLAQRPYQLAEAGLYYTGVEDHCRCFACDGGLRKWEPGDDPWIEHCRWFPACPFAIETKGREFIDLIQLSADQAVDENASSPQEDMTNSVAAMSIEDPLVQIIVDSHASMLHGSMGFPFEEIKHAVLELVQQGNKAPNVQDIVTQIEVITERNAMLREFKMTQHVEETEDGILKENTRLKEMLMCCICGKNNVNILFLPCTHHKVCLGCSINLDRCPLCKREIKDKIRTYML